MRTLFLGNDAIAIPALKALTTITEVVSVITAPDKPGRRGSALVPMATKVEAESLGLPVMHEDINSQRCLSILNPLRIDLIVVMAFGQILRRPILDLPTLGCVNLHASLLPAYRGASPIQTALLNGDKQTGVTIQKMVRQLDAGPILFQKALSTDSHNAVSLSAAISELAAQTLTDWYESRARSNLMSGEPQNESEATFCHKIAKADAEFSFEEPAEHIARKIRAYAGWPKCRAQFRDQPYIFLNAEASASSHDDEPGLVAEIQKDRFALTTAKGWLWILEGQAAGKKALSGHEMMNGLKLNVGDRFTTAAE